MILLVGEMILQKASVYGPDRGPRSYSGVASSTAALIDDDTADTAASRR